MKRHKDAEIEISRTRMVKAFLPLLDLLPSASNMTTFAAQFSKDEWDYLCRNHLFVELMDHDLIKAKSIARSILKRALN